MKKLIFGLATFFTSVLGILGSMFLSEINMYFLTYNIYSSGNMYGASLFAFVITAVIGFVFALIGALSRDKNENKK